MTKEPVLPDHTTALRIQLSRLETDRPGAGSARAPAFEFHIANKVRRKYQFHEKIYSIRGNVILADFRAVRHFAHLMNLKKDTASSPEAAVRPGHLNSMGLIDEILHYVGDLYRRKNPSVFREALDHLEAHIGGGEPDRTLLAFVESFSPLRVYRGEISAADYLKGQTEGVTNREIVLEELLLLNLANGNPAFGPFMELFDHGDLSEKTGYQSVCREMESFFKTRPGFGPGNPPLVNLLRAPAVASPNSLTGQLLYIKNNWGMLLSRFFLDRLLSAHDLIKEEEKQRVGTGSRPMEIPDYTRDGREGALYEEPERFSPDPDWMSRLVLIAKSIHVWLDQLSRAYNRPIGRLDQIPDEELDRLAGWGFTGLWLIGIWERSTASRKIKQICGNPEAAPSAYSIFDYVIAEDLGGEPAFQDLKARAWQRGIRLASDMVPNHMGIYSRWTLSDPDWFIQTGDPPFPNYSFTGPDLSEDERVCLQIEDGYWERRDAAVVFKRLDQWTGDARYIYHGNDGTSMPWNDTAQLNFLRADVREAVIQLILHVARKFSIIRFDAAMTLTKRHYQRLWFPRPGTGGDIPSRTGHTLSREKFDELFPAEFWREVVDRVAAEAPDTLLLAEAFWLMEGYFVRTLGMHRVYNSAFMNMVKMEENAKYRSVMKNVLAFNPEILKRFVNFMNNPDEETAVAQFGKGDKYLGTAVMMATMPGLPMFGHGQIEGFTEKYGMEYRRAYWDEPVDDALVRRHERYIFPLLKKRYLFSGVDHFVLYDFYGNDGPVNENVYAYSNRRGDERALVVYNNAYESASGWIRTSCSMSVPAGPQGGRQSARKNLAEGLGIDTSPGLFYIFRDDRSGLEFIRSGRDLSDKGLYAELGGYEYHLFSDFRAVRDDREGIYGRLDHQLNGRGVPDIGDAAQEMKLAPILTPFREFVHEGLWASLEQTVPDREKYRDILPDLSRLIAEKQRAFLEAAKHYFQGDGDPESLAREQIALLGAIQEGRLCAPSPGRKGPGEPPAGLEKLVDETFGQAAPALSAFLEQSCFGPSPEAAFYRRILFAWALVQNLSALRSGRAEVVRPDQCLDQWRISSVLKQTLTAAGADEAASEKGVLLIKILVRYGLWPEEDAGPFPWFPRILDDDAVRRYIRVHQHDDVLWFNKEDFEGLFSLLFTVYLIRKSAVPSAAPAREDLQACFDFLQRLFKIASDCEYRFETLKAALNENGGQRV
jgi:glycosidase